MEVGSFSRRRDAARGETGSMEEHALADNQNHEMPSDEKAFSYKVGSCFWSSSEACPYALPASPLVVLRRLWKLPTSVGVRHVCRHRCDAAEIRVSVDVMLPRRRRWRIEGPLFLDAPGGDAIRAPYVKRWPDSRRACGEGGLLDEHGPVVADEQLHDGTLRVPGTHLVQPHAHDVRGAHHRRREHRAQVLRGHEVLLLVLRHPA